MNRNETIRKELEAMAEPKYRDFSAALVPGEKKMLGVRIPNLREMAKRIAKEDPVGYLDKALDDSFEEIMVQGMVIGQLPAKTEEEFSVVWSYVRRHVPKISNWSLCDSFCASLKFAKKRQSEVWQRLQPYLQSEKTYEVRFAMVMMLQYFVTEEYIDSLFQVFDSVHHNDYYVKMAVAWACSVCFVKFPEKTEAYLKRSRMDDETYAMTLQKIRDSRRVSEAAKARLVKRT